MHARSRLRRASLLALAMLALPGCSDATAPAFELQQARARWAARQPAAYRMVVAQQCFCGVAGPIEVVVRGGVVQSRRDMTTGEPVEPGISAGRAGAVEELFGLVAGAIELDADHVDVSFDRALGYPLRIAVDYDVRMVDDELVVTVHDFAAIE